MVIVHILNGRKGLAFLAYGWISQVAINNRGNKAFVLIQKQSHLFTLSILLLVVLSHSLVNQIPSSSVLKR